MERKRLVAKRCRVRDLIKGRYVSKDSLSPSYVVTPYGMIVSKVNLIGIVVQVYISEDKNYGFIVIEDGTGSIRGKVFNNTKLIEDIAKGDFVRVIGRVREYNDERYISIDAVWKIKSVEEEIVARMDLITDVVKFIKKMKRVKELIKEHENYEVLKEVASKEGIEEDVVFGVIEAKSYEEQMTEEEKEEEDKESVKEMIIKIINENDEGDGVEYLNIVEKSGLPESVVEQALNELLSEGTCYEPKPGKIKLV